MDPEQLAAAVAVADESLAAQTTDYRLQAAIAQDRPDLWAALASNPTTYPSLLTWLSSIQEPAVQRALEARGIAPQAETVPQTGEGAPEEGRPDEPAGPQADGGAPEEPAEPEAEEAAESQTDEAASEELAGPQIEDDAESQADEAAPEEAAGPQADGGAPEEPAEPEAEEAAESQADEAASEELAGPQIEDDAESQADGAGPEEAAESQADEAAPEELAGPQIEDDAESQADEAGPEETAESQADEAAPEELAGPQAEEAAGPQMDEDRPDEAGTEGAGPEEAAESQADGAASEELAGPQAVDDAESQADGAAPEEAAEPQAAEDVPAEASEPGAGVVLSDEEAAESRADEAEKTGSEPEDETEPQEPAEPQTDGSAPADAGEPQKGEDAPEAAAEPQVDKTVPVVLPLKAPPAPVVEASSAPSVASSAGASASPSVSPFSADFASHAMAAASNSSYASSGSFVPTQDRTAASRGSAASPPRSRKLMIVTLVLALLLAGGTGGWFLMSAIYKDSPVALSLPGTGRKTHQGKKSARDSATSDSDSRSVSAADDPAGTSATNYVTPCGSAPTFTPTSVKNGEGELKVEVKVTASCPSGDVLGGTANHIEMKGPSRSDGTGSADALIASGDFDFSDSPLVIPDSGTSLMLRFGDGHFFRTADDVDVKTVTVDCTPDRDSGAGGATAGTSSASGSSGPSSAAASTTSRDSTSEESAAGSSLRWQADHDKPTITRSLTGKWVAQLSSKKPGLVADGITWDNRATLQEFLELRQKYPSAKLLYSEDWPVFDAGGQYWVTIAGTPYSTAAEANAWCEAQGFDAEHCFAKYIDTKGPSEGTTVNR